ncbi:MAG: hypothetical protein Kow00122_20120 [Thermoleophilia bacterium]
MARKERRDGQGERDRDRERPADSDLGEPERDSLTALKTILTKVATVVKPLGLSPEESTDLVQRMYENVLEMDLKLAAEPDDERKARVLEHIRQAEIRREDDVLVVEYPSET